MNKKSSTATYSGTWSNKTYEVEFTATGNYWYQPCIMYFKDGTGQPEDWDVEDIEVTIKSIRNLKTGYLMAFEIDHYLTADEIKDIKEKIADACYEGEYDMKLKIVYGIEPDDEE